VFGVASAAFAGLTVLLPVLVMAFFINKAEREPNDPDHFWAWLSAVIVGGGVSVVASGLSSLVGSIAGGVALARGERRGWLAGLGLVVNAPVLLFAIYLVAMAFFNNG
jgi:hypothetical protein